jgi:hypothetical protein
VEAHQGEYRVENYAELYDAISHGPGVLRATRQTPEVESFDWDMNAPMTEARTTSLSGTIIKFVDYLKNGVWKRVAIQQYAYLCNDDGKTIAKIGVPA